MYVCLCNGYREDEIREVAEGGVRCAQEAYLTLGNGPCCGTCLDFAQQIVDGVHAPAGIERTAEANLNSQAEQAGESVPAGAEALLMAAE